MMYIVEVGSADADIGAVRGHMQTWLDRNHCEPAMFRQVTGYGAGNFLRVEFASERDAAAFAKSFAGRMLRPELSH